MRLTLGLTIAALWFAVHAPVEGAAGWETNYARAIEIAREKQRPVLIEFTAPWCHYCRLMESTTLQDESLRPTLDQFVKAAVNFDVHTNLVERHGIRGIPAFVILNPDGDEVLKASGYMETRRFSEWLLQGMSAAALSMARQELFLEECQALQAALAGVDPVQKQRGLAMLFNFCAKEKPYQMFAAAKLQDLASRDPTMLLDGLKHPRLATRIQMANLLRGKLGEEFKVDPWESAGVREENVETWKARLSTRK